MKLSTTKTQLTPRKLPAYLCGIAISGIIGLSSCASDTSSQDYTETKVIESYTNGVITEVEEVKKDIFKITDENIVEAKEDSRIIASYLDGTLDTFTLDEIRLVDSDTSRTDYRRRSSMSGIVTGGLMGYFLGRSLSTPTNPNSYKNGATHTKSNATNSALRSTAKTRTVRTPSRSSSGYGGGKSTRSYGG